MFCNYLKNSKRFELIWLKDGLPMLENFQIKYGLVGNEITNNVPYWNFSKLGIEFELKSRKLQGLKFNRIWWNLIGIFKNWWNLNKELLFALG
jgi:hypothetical protein